jgi:energy-coupling factor transporter ATP-binding protein EcfA2
VHDLPRVMRLPGFFHRKREPFQSQLLIAEDRPAFSGEAVLSAYSPRNVDRDSMPKERARLSVPQTNAYLARYDIVLPALPSMRGAFGDAAIEGERHEKLVSHIGAKIAAGRDIEDVRLIARGWNSGLSDPLSPTEIDATVRDCFRRYAAQKSDGNHERPPALQLRRASDIERQPISWLWRDWLAKGKLHVLAGPPGSGKTTVALSLAAILSRGGMWPDGTQAEVGNVLMWSGEDAPEDTLAPRLVAAGADLDRIYFIGDVGSKGARRAFDPATDMALLEAEAIRIGNIALLIVDPIVNAVTGDSHKNTEVRSALQPLVDLGASLNAAVLGISHFSKGSQGRQPTERVTGSLAFGALARVVLVAVKNEGADGTRTLARSKSNIGPDSGGFTYELEQVDCDGINASRVRWGEHVTGSALQLLNEAEAANTRSDDTRLWLEERLANGPVEVAVLKAETKGSGMSWRTLERVKKELHAVAVRVSAGNEGKGSWFWQLMVE